MNKEFIPYEEALALKELGFEEGCLGYYYGEEFIACNSSGEFIPYKKQTDNNSALAPLYQQAFTWFREELGLIGKVDLELEYKGKKKGKKVFERTGFWSYSIIKLDEKYPEALGFDLKDKASFEEAELACLRKLIEIVNQNKDDE
jgi:hypothetical protein